jgi:excinuclease ABC subunit B
MIHLKGGDEIERNALLRRFVDVQYKRNDIAFERGTFRVRGDTIEIIPMYEELAIRIEMFGDEIEKIMTLHPLTGEILRDETEIHIFPATHYAASPETMKRVLGEMNNSHANCFIGETICTIDPAKKAKSKDKSLAQGALFVSGAGAR